MAPFLACLIIRFRTPYTLNMGLEGYELRQREKLRVWADDLLPDGPHNHDHRGDLRIQESPARNHLGGVGHLGLVLIRVRILYRPRTTLH